MQRSIISGTVAGIASLLLVPAVTAEPRSPSRGEVLLFASAEAYQSDDSLEGVLSADVLASWTSGRVRVLGELLLSTEEQELERLQLGWEIVPETLVWVGRFHQPGSYWNTREHHGQYLQTSITRPAIEDWEDDSGVLPQHVEGLLLESRRELTDSRGLTLSASVGVGPVLRDGKLEPYEVLSPRQGDRGASYGLQASFLPDYSGSGGIGLLAQHSEIMLADSDPADEADHIDLDVAGVYFDFTREPWRVVSSTYWIRTTFEGTSRSSGDSFVSGYLQVQRSFGERFTALGRVEASSGAEDSAYVALFREYIEQRQVVGLRWDFARRQAITFECANTDSLRDTYQEYRMQWSAALR